jgi:hypothetical protein
VREVAKQYLDGREVTEGLLNHIEVAIRAFDPCLSCATHALGQMPLEVLKVYADIDDGEPPPCWLLAIRAEHFELGEGLSKDAQEHLHAALLAAVVWMDAGAQG